MNIRPLLLGLVCVALALPAGARPRVAVLVVVDQLRATDVDRLAPLFGTGGFGGLLVGGAQVDLRYPFAVTETGPGHATLATGAGPSVHGITANRWWQGERLEYCVEDDGARVLGAAEGAIGLGPQNLQVGTLGDALKLATGGHGRVVTLSHKDRAAILTAGFAADVASWFDPELGAFTTSSRYAKTLPAWLDALARERIEHSLAHSSWEPLPVPPALAWLVPADDAEGEDARLGGRTFPHALEGDDRAARLRDYRGTPQAMDDLFKLADAAIEHEQLGQDEVPDLLVLGVSSADFIGHWFGPDSAEMVDILRRLDGHLRTLRSSLDSRFGAGGYVLAVTGDHGGLSLPERSRSLRVPSGRIDAPKLFQSADEAIQKALPRAPVRKWLVGFQAPHLWLDLSGLSPADQDVALEAARATIAAHEGVAGTWRSDQLQRDDDPFADTMLRARFAGRTGQLFVRARPRWFFDYAEGTGTDHGSPYAYDARVPLFLVGGGVLRGRYAEERDPRDVAPTIAWLLGTPPPDAAEGRPISFLLRTGRELR